MTRPWALAPGLLLLLAGCSPSPNQLKAALKKHPEILAEAIREHPAEIMEALQAASDSYQKVAQACERLSRSKFQYRQSRVRTDRLSGQRKHSALRLLPVPSPGGEG